VEGVDRDVLDCEIAGLDVDEKRRRGEQRT
jgi:hypothetical protein